MACARRLAVALLWSAAGSGAFGEPAASSASTSAGSGSAQAAYDAIRERLARKGLAPVAAPEDASGTELMRVGKPDAASKSVSGGARTAVQSGDVVVGRRSDRSAPRSGHGASISAHAAHWSYDGDGSPDRWAAISPEFAACSKGLRQSPIDIRDGIKVDLEPVRFSYRPSAFSVVDTGHTVQVNVAPGNSIDIGGRHFELVQFHFHKPSEERIDGRRFDMVVHMVHKDAAGKLAVVAVLLEKGEAQPVVQSVWNNLPLEKSSEVEAGTPLDPGALLPVDRRYFTYMGSLTTPPCSEGVLWMVMKSPLPISDEQIGIFARLYPMNARPLQAASARLIKESN